MDKCTDPDIGRLIHAYELNGLSAEERELFEVHLLDCEYCFKEVRQMEVVSDLLNADADVKYAFGEAKTDLSLKTSFWSRLKSMFFPDTSWYAKPALVYFALLLLVYPAYRGIFVDGKRPIESATSISLIPDRSVETVYGSTDNDIVLNIVYPEFESGADYSLSIVSESDDTIFWDQKFNGFDSYGTAVLLIPEGRLEPGVYSVTIKGVRGLSGIAERKYSFLIRGK